MIVHKILSYFRPKTMVLVKTDRHGEVTELRSKGTFIELSRVVKDLIKEYEAKGLMLIKDEAHGVRGRVTEFATEKNGWECGFFIAGSWVTNIRKQDDNDEEKNNF